MSRMNDATIDRLNASSTKAVISDGAGSPLVVIDAKTKRPVTGALVMFPGSDFAALRALCEYNKVAGNPGSPLEAWERAAWDMWDAAFEAKAIARDEADEQVNHDMREGHDV